MSPPFGFSNRLARWVGNECSSGIVSCEFRPAPQPVRERWDLIEPLPQGDHQGRAKRVQDSQISVFTTGFLVGQDEGASYVLTCAHALGPVFNQEYVLTVQRARELYQPYILCEHREMRYMTGEDENRVPLRVDIAYISCFRDLLLRVSRYRFPMYCPHHHRNLRIAPAFPAEFKTVVMISWPPLRNRTRAIGNVSHCARNQTQLARDNPYNYQMLLTEVDIRSDKGSSGAPLLDGEADVAGVLHGGDRRYSYFISIDDIRAALQQEWHLLI